jgi:c-di-GMP-binding flagellar brake protein YcgR
MRLSGIRLDPDGDLVENLQMLDISRGGMGAFCERAFYPGQRIVLCLPLTGDRGRRNVYAAVVRSAEMKGGYRVGLQFDPASAANSCSVAEAVVAA